MTELTRDSLKTQNAYYKVGTSTLNSIRHEMNHPEWTGFQ